jgi:glycosyltransferase involved in cell wall biosynthesis
VEKKAPLTLIIPTYNEEVNVEHCLESIYKWVSEIIIVDSLSTDRTLEICKKYTDKIYQHPFENHGKQVNWSLDNIPIACDWIMQLDADEMVTPELANELCQILPTLPEEVSGLYAKRRVFFMGRWIRHGDYYPMWLLRVFRQGKARNEEFEEDRVVLLQGEASHLKHDFIDYNRKPLTFWTEKHNQWASNEMRDLLTLSKNDGEKLSPMTIRPSLLASQDKRRRWLKKNLYARTPLFVRAFSYFLYRYILRLGFLDGTEGLIFHFLQGCWYRFYVDAKIYEAKKIGTWEKGRSGSHGAGAYQAAGIKRT